MTLILVTSPKGGAGASILATNLALSLGRQDRCLLLDLHGGDGVDDLLLDLVPDHAWHELASLGDGVTAEHLQTAATTHPTGLALVAAPSTSLQPCTPEQAAGILQSLAAWMAWTVADLPPAWASTRPFLAPAEAVLIVTTSDPPALRCTANWIGSIPMALRGKLGLVLNQHSARQPITPKALAASLEIPLLAALPADPHGIGDQIHFGQPPVLARSSEYGRGVRTLALRLAALAQAQSPTGGADWARLQAHPNEGSR